MTRRVVITGLGPVSGLGLGIEPNWSGAVEGRSAIGKIDVFNPEGFDCHIAAQVRDFAVRDFVPKSYRKATKVMAADIELAVAAAMLAARDAGLRTAGTDPEAAGKPDFKPTYEPARVGCHIGAALIAADINELTGALYESRGTDGTFDYHHWGREGINHLTPLWLLKFLPNMLACHVTIIHDAQGPSNTITCSEASAMLSIGESLRVIQRGWADASFCGGAEDKLNPMAYLRQQFAGVLNTTSNDRPGAALRPFDQDAAGTIVGQGGGIAILEALETFQRRRQATGGDGPAPRAYAEVVGFGASQSVHLPQRNLKPDPNGRGIALSIRAALRDAKLEPDAIDLIIPFGSGVPESDQAEAAAIFSVFGSRAKEIPVTPIKPMTGNAFAGAGGIDACIAAKAVAEQKIPAVINCDAPIDGLNVKTAPSREAKLEHVLTFSSSYGGQNAALVLKRL